jgi:hypothetical protein
MTTRPTSIVSLAAKMPHTDLNACAENYVQLPFRRKLGNPGTAADR